ncbi:MAG: hypothetical protein SVU69_09750 [Pseudomonadota bacterium]|nr:hypothetical protein [Pseudomonadota bacterium]
MFDSDLSVRRVRAVYRPRGRMVAVAIRLCIAMLLVLGCWSGAGYATDLQDPFQPPTAGRTAPTPAWVLQSILISAERRVAIINGQSALEGEHVSGAQVVAIEPNLVRIRKGGRDMMLTLNRDGSDGIRTRPPIAQAP